MCMLSHFNCVQVFATPWTVVHEVPLSMGFSRQEHGVGYHFLQRIFLSQRLNSCLLCLLPWQAGSLLLEPPLIHFNSYCSTFDSKRQTACSFYSPKIMSSKIELFQSVARREDWRFKFLLISTVEQLALHSMYG